MAWFESRDGTFGSFGFGVVLENTGASWPWVWMNVLPHGHAGRSSWGKSSGPGEEATIVKLIHLRCTPQGRPKRLLMAHVTEASSCSLKAAR